MEMSYCKTNGGWHIATDEKAPSIGPLRAVYTKCGMRTVSRPRPQPTDPEPVCVECASPDANTVARRKASYARLNACKSK